MTWTFWTRKGIALIVAVLTLAGSTAVLSVSLTRPKPFASAVLSAQWQCTKTAGILTVCTKNPD
ncbi:MAG: hypothetical protein JWP25_2376 [Bradyrhizobium sp.]|jgi:hypothetical protein|nr:hypothetical protein [Bradyrhizobium sp.]